MGVGDSIARLDLADCHTFVLKYVFKRQFLAEDVSSQRQHWYFRKYFLKLYVVGFYF